jgi:hypothetical protein
MRLVKTARNSLRWTARLESLRRVRVVEIEPRKAGNSIEAQLEYRREVLRAS